MERVYVALSCCAAPRLTRVGRTVQLARAHYHARSERAAIRVGEQSRSMDDDFIDFRARRTAQLRRVICCTCCAVCGVLGLVVGACVMLARWLAKSAAVRSLDDRLSFASARLRNRHRRQPPSRAIIHAPIGAIVLITGEIRFRDVDDAEALRVRLSNVSVVVVTWRRCEKLAKRVAPAGLLLVDELAADRLAIPHGGALQFYLLQLAVKHFRPQLRAASVVARLRTDAQYAESFALPTLTKPPSSGSAAAAATEAAAASATGAWPSVAAIAAGVVVMETDLAFAATGSTFVRVFGGIYDTMVARRYFRHREEQRAMPPNFAHVALSDATSTGERGWRTRWRWLDYPTAVFVPERRYSAADIVAVAREHAARLASLRLAAPNISVRRLTTVPPVPRFCAESAFLHHTLEAAAVGPLRGVSLARREERCPDGNRRRHGGLRECTGWLVE